MQEKPCTNTDTHTDTDTDTGTVYMQTHTNTHAFDPNSSVWKSTLAFSPSLAGFTGLAGSHGYLMTVSAVGSWLSSSEAEGGRSVALQKAPHGGRAEQQPHASATTCLEITPVY